MNAERSPLVARLWRVQVLTVLLAGTATVLIGVFSAFSFGYRDESLRVGLGTAAALIAGLAAFLLYGRYRLGRRTDVLVLFWALVAVTVANTARILGPRLTSVDVDPVAVWLPLSLQVFASLLLAAAAFAPVRRVKDLDRARSASLLVVAAGCATAIVALVLAPHLAVGIDPAISPASSGSPRIIGAPGLLALQLLVMALAFLAGAGFTLAARRQNDELLAWLAVAAVLIGFSRLNYFLFPSIYTGWVFTGDLLRVAAYVLILVGAMRQIALFQRHAQEAAVLEERRRIARDLHDSVGQDLAFIAMRASTLDGDDARVGQITAAAEHALLGSRAVIASIARDEEPFEASVERLATRLCRRAEVPLRLEVPDGLEAGHERREVLLRILAEAIGNSVQHGRPSSITVELSGQGSTVRLLVRDDGVGFDGTDTGSGFGLGGMQERVAKLGGEFDLRTGPGEGTEVEVVLR